MASTHDFSAHEDLALRVGRVGLASCFLLLPFKNCLFITILLLRLAHGLLLLQLLLSFEGSRSSLIWVLACVEITFTIASCESVAGTCILTGWVTN